MKKVLVIFAILILSIVGGTSVAAAGGYESYAATENEELCIEDVFVTSRGNTIRTSVVEGNNYLFLPTDYHTSAMYFGCKTKGEEIWAYRDGLYFKDLKNVRSFDLKNVADYDTVAGAYVLTMRAVTVDEKAGTLEYSEYVLYVMQSENIASMFITFEDPAYGRAWVDSSADHTNNAAAFTEVNMCMVNEQGGSVYEDTLTQFKGRGNTTWKECSKKPYQIKLNKKTDLLESNHSENKNKTWVLLANSLDITMFRNAMALDLAQYLGLTSSPEYRYVDLYFDGIYRGVYLLCEKVQINKGRLEIKDSEDFTSATDPEATAQCTNIFGMTVQYNPTATAEDDPENGGFLLEEDADAYALAENCWFQTPDGRYVVVKSPECATQEQMLYISERFTQMYYAARSGAYEDVSVENYLDVDSFAAICLLNEYLLNVDYMASSTFFFLPEKGNANYEYKFYAGPAWDFDGTMGCRQDQEEFLDPTLIRYYGKYYFESTEVQKAVQNKALELEQLGDLFFADEPVMDAKTGLKSMAFYKQFIEQSAGLNYKVNALTPLWNYLYFDSFEEGCDYTIDFMKQRHELIFSSIISPSLRCAKYGHSPSDTPSIVAATCTGNGRKTYYCTVCGEAVKTETIKATGHTPVKVPAVQATAKKSGLTEGEKCAVCGKVLKRQTMTLAQVTGLKALSAAKTSVKLSWSKIAGAKYYKVEQYDSIVKQWKVIGTTTSTTRTVSKLSAGTDYKFRVTAQDKTGTISGKKSSPLMVYTLCKAPAVKLTAPKKGAVKVTITKVKGAESYIIYMSKDGEKWTRVTTTTGSTYTISGLTAGKKLYVRAVAVNRSGVKSAAGIAKHITVR